MSPSFADSPGEAAYLDVAFRISTACLERNENPTLLSQSKRGAWHLECSGDASEPGGSTSAPSSILIISAPVRPL